MKRGIALLILCALMAALLSGCHAGLPVGTHDTLTGEEYPDAGKYQTGAFTYAADGIAAVEVYWRSGEVELIESEQAELNAEESGSTLPENSAMHYLLEDGVLRIRFCASGTKIRVDTTDKHLRLEIPKNVDVSVHATSAVVRAETLEQNRVLIAALSGATELGTVTAGDVNLSSSSGSIRADSVSAQALKCAASSGSVDLGGVSAETVDCSASSGSVSVESVSAETVRITTSSGSVDAALTDVPAAEIHTSSGSVRLALAADGAEVLYTSSSGKLHTERAYERKGDLYVFGSGACSLTVETTSGNLAVQ